ncbi:unnamed protein product [Acanthosepion pharaonis]|uniref:BZIP domain-containing protein n=1 Tax=Acanthosepion pharaonis TaxID=158019 RepID=A0A812BB51_ACAPH|nr:unnamed protein product [Sepia pharaonis]
MHILKRMAPRHHQQQIHCDSGEGNRVCGSVALEIGKDFLLPDSSVMPEGDNAFTGTSSSSSSSSPFRADSQSQLHPSDEENDYILQSRREKNRKAAQKCREKKKEKIRILENTVKDLNNDIRILKCRNTKLEEEKERLEYLLKLHNRCCPLKVENEFVDVYPAEEQFNPGEEQVPRTSHQVYRDQSIIPPGYLYQTETYHAQ